MSDDKNKLNGENADKLNELDSTDETPAEKPDELTEGTSESSENSSVDLSDGENTADKLGDFTDDDKTGENLEKQKPVKSGKFNPFTSRKFKRGGISVLFTVIFVTAVILINIVVNTLLTRFDIRVDLTENRLYSIEKNTADYLGSVNDNVTFYICSNELDFIGQGTYYSQSNEIVQKFVLSNNKFDVQYVDLMSNPAFSAKYGGELVSSDIIIESEVTGRYRIIHTNEYITVTYYANGQKITADEASYYQYFGYEVDYDISASAEQSFLSAIMSVTDITPVNVAFASGFGEGQVSGSSELIYDYMVSLLEKNAYTIETVDMLLIDQINPDLDFLVIYSPAYDYTVEVIDKIDKWLDNNGALGKNLIYIPAMQMAETPNLDSLLEEWGIKTEYGYAYQTNTNYASASSGFEQYLQTNNYFTQDMSGIFACAYIRPLTQVFESFSGMTTYPLISTYDGAVNVPADADENWQPAENDKGIIHAGIMSEKMRYDQLTPISSRVIAFGSPYMFSGYYLEAEQAANAKFLMNMMNDLSGKESNTVTLVPKSFYMSTFEITAQQAYTIAIIFAVVLPLLVIAAGVTVFLRRRYR